MKARIKKTGEVLKIADYAVIAMENCDSYGNPLEYKPEEVELIDETTIINNIDWEQRKFELVKVAMQGLAVMRGWKNEQYVATMSIKIADEVLTEYKKGVKQ